MARLRRRPRSSRLRQRADVKTHRVRPNNVLDALREADVAVALRERTRYDANVLSRCRN